MSRERHEAELTIERLGAGGDGVATRGGRPVYVPFTLPGERWRVRINGERGSPATPLALEPRREPPCRHFGRCGGCALQHLPEDAYTAFKRRRIEAALARRGLAAVPFEPTAVSPPGSRRRLRLAFDRDRRLGLRQRLSRRIEPLETCVIARPELVDLLRPLRQAAAFVAPAELTLTRTAAGVDLVVHHAGAPDLAGRERLAGLADALDLARVAWAAAGGEPEPIIERRAPALDLAGRLVKVPPGTFLQATAEGEAALMAAVAAWGRGAARAVDLYAGLGTLALAQAATGAAVHAVEAEAAPLRALAAAEAPRLTTERRDLKHRPLLADELRRFDVALLDPPRAGAREQAAALAGSSVARVVYASCSPESFARDARILADGGLELVTVRPIDQFLFAAEVELIALFERGAPRA